MLPDITRALLLVDDSRRGREGNVARVIPAVAGILNLFLCASFEPSLKTDQTGHALSLFFLLQVALFTVLTVIYFSRQLHPVLMRVRIFPGSSIDRYFFVVSVNLRRRIVLALLLSTFFSLAIIYSHDPVVAGAAILLYGLLACAIQALLATTLMVLARTRYPAASGLALGGLFCVGFAAGLLTSGADDFLAVLPPLNWAVEGVLAAMGGTVTGVLFFCGVVASTAALAAGIGSRTS